MNPAGGFTPVFSSASMLVRISPPTPWLDDKSAPSHFFRFERFKHEFESVGTLLSKINSGDESPSSWVDDLTEVASFQQKMSIIAARHICMGEWHNAFLDLEADFSLWIPTGREFQLAKNYIDSVYLVISTSQNSEFCLTWSASIMKKTYRFRPEPKILCRKVFDEQVWRAPNFQQMFQGSKECLMFGQYLTPNIGN